MLAALALVVTGVPATAQEDADPSEVKIAADGFLLGTQAWISLDQGYFDENSVEADVSLFGTGIEAIQGVIARQADLGHALDFAVLNLVAAADENMQIVGGIAQPNPGFHSLAVQNGITGPEDLVGKKIGYVEGTSEHFVTIQYLVQNGISLDDVELVPLPGLFELVGALKTGDIDASWLWLDGTTQAAEDPNLTILTDDSDVLETVAIFLIAEAAWAAENQLAIERVLKSYDQASAFAEADPVAAGQIVADAVSGNAELFANTIPNQRYQVGFSQVMLDSLDAIAGFLIESGVLAEDFDVRDFVDLEAQERAVPGSVTADLG
jgi:ABC-type nitrate/sulfonate/bicarbonate transport system substrate-binding protein